MNKTKLEFSDPYVPQYVDVVINDDEEEADIIGRLEKLGKEDAWWMDQELYEFLGTHPTGFSSLQDAFTKIEQLLWRRRIV